MNEKEKQFDRCRGVTIIELVIAVAMVTIIFAAILPQFVIIRNSWDIKQASAETNQNGRVLMDHIERNISSAKKITIVSNSSTASGYIEFVDYNDVNNRYDIRSANNYVEFGPLGSLSDLAGPVSSLKFTCYDACDLTTPIIDGNDIRVVKIEAAFSNASPSGQTKTFTAWAYLRVNSQNDTGWSDDDIGSVAASGSASFSSSTDKWTVIGSGVDIWNNTDEYHYVYQTLSGDGQIVAKVLSVTNTDPWAKAGVMIRETLTGGSKHAMMVVTPGSGNAFQRRTSTGGVSTHTAGSVVTAPYWVKMTRKGNTLTGFESANGAAWTQVDTDTISMATDVYIGLCVTSHNDGSLCTSDFNNVSFMTFQSFLETKAASDSNTSVTIPTPAVNVGDLLIAAVATDGDTHGSIAPVGLGWTLIDRGAYNNAVTLGAWWKNAGSSEPANHIFSWTGGQQAYGWMMRFTGHDAANPVSDFAYGNSTGSTTPISPAVTTTADCSLVLRLGAFNDDSIIVDSPGLTNHSPITMDKSASSTGGTVTYLGFNENAVNSGSITVPMPAGASAGDLLIAAVSKDGSAAISAPAGWNLINQGNDSLNQMTLGVWWRFATASDPIFSWSGGNERAYGWIMRFSGHDPATPINASQFQQGTSASHTPTCPAVTTTVANTIIVRIGGFDKNSVNIDDTGLPAGYSDITMDRSGTGSGSCSGGAGYILQAASGNSGPANFTLSGSNSEEYRTVTIAIAPSAVSNTVSGAAGYVKQATAGSSGTSNFSLTASKDARLLTIAIAPDSTKASACCGNEIRP